MTKNKLPDDAGNWPLADGPESTFVAPQSSVTFINTPSKKEDHTPQRGDVSLTALEREKILLDVINGEPAPENESQARRGRQRSPGHGP